MSKYERLSKWEIRRRAYCEIYGDQPWENSTQCAEYTKDLLKRSESWEVVILALGKGGMALLPEEMERSFVDHTIAGPGAFAFAKRCACRKTSAARTLTNRGLGWLIRQPI